MKSWAFEISENHQATSGIWLCLLFSIALHALLMFSLYYFFQSKLIHLSASSVGVASNTLLVTLELSNTGKKNWKKEFTESKNSLAEDSAYDNFTLEKKVGYDALAPDTPLDDKVSQSSNLQNGFSIDRLKTESKSLLSGLEHQALEKRERRFELKNDGSQPQQPYLTGSDTDALDSFNSMPKEKLLGSPGPDNNPHQLINSMLQGGDNDPTQTQNDQDAILSQFKAQLLLMIDSKKIYPLSARRYGREGQVTLSFVILKNGMIENIHLESSSGWKDLDRSALRSLKKIKQYQPIPQELEFESLRLTATLNYVLEG